MAKSSRVEDLELERSILDSQIKTLRFLGALEGSHGGDVEVTIDATGPAQQIAGITRD